MALPPGMLLRPLERFTITAPLGVRFWDVAAREVVRSGMTMQGCLIGDPLHTLKAFPNGSGVLLLRDLPSLRAFEAGDGSHAFWQRWSQPVIELALTVFDERHRFQPFRFVCGAPQKGFARCSCPTLSPPRSRIVADAPEDAVPVYPAPTRLAPAGLAVVRTQLMEPPEIVSPPRDPVYGAWAFVEALVDGQAHPVGASYADEQGRIAIMFPFPAPTDGSLLSPPSPPAASSGGLLMQRWRVRLRAYYDRLAPNVVPDLCDVLAQRPATLWDDSALIHPFAGRELAYGSELVVRSRGGGGSPPADMSELLITPGP